MIDARERYMSDPQFKALVDMMVGYMMNCDFTPSEMRLAAIMASIQYEYYRVDRVIKITPELEEQLRNVSKSVNELMN